MFSNQPPKKQEVMPAPYWVQYNNNYLFNPDATVAIYVNGKIQDSPSYTHYFFKTFDLEKYLNKDCQSILALGASTGKFIVDHKKQHKDWEIAAYEWTEFAVTDMKREGINAKKIDLNSINKIDKTLNYLNELKIDLENPTNIFAFRILEYLDEPTAKLLVLTMLDLAKPGSVLMIGNITSPDGKTKFTTAPGHYASLFESRKDVEILKTDNAHAADPTNKERHDIDSIVVVRKR